MRAILEAEAAESLGGHRRASEEGVRRLSSRHATPRARDADPLRGARVHQPRAAAGEVPRRSTAAQIAGPHRRDQARAARGLETFAGSTGVEPQSYPSYTSEAVKTAISLPDPLFEGGREEVAKKRGISRSEALRERARGASREVAERRDPRGLRPRLTASNRTIPRSVPSARPVSATCARERSGSSARRDLVGRSRRRARLRNLPTSIRRDRRAARRAQGQQVADDQSRSRSTSATWTALAPWELCSVALGKRVYRAELGRRRMLRLDSRCSRAFASPSASCQQRLLAAVPRTACGSTLDL